MSRVVAWLLIAALLLVACGGVSEEGSFAEAPSAMPAPAEEADAEEQGFTDVDTALPEGEGAALAAQVERKIIRDVDLSLRVEDAGVAAERVAAIAEEFGGYVATTNLYRGGDDQLQGSVTVRIPAEELDEALALIKGLSEEAPLGEQSESRDVTEEYVDLQARLENLERTELELQALLTEIRENAQSAEEVLNVYRELTTIRGEIEQIEGRLNYLDNLVAFSTVTVNLFPPTAIVRDPAWSPTGAVESALSVLISGLQFLVSAAIFILVAVLPLLVIALLPLVLLIWLIRRWRRSRDLPTTAA